MRTIAILPVKAFDVAKKRLADLLASGSRQALAQAMFSDVLAALRRVQGLDAIAVVTADRSAEAAAGAAGAVVLRDPVEAGQSAAVAIGIRHALAGGFDRALLVPGDTPLLDPSEIEALLERNRQRPLQVTIVPDRHGTGTNALILVPPDALEPSFGPGSLERHAAMARDAGLTCRLERPPSLLHDVDTPDDLAELYALLDRERGRAPRTRGALRQLDHSRARGAGPRRSTLLGQRAEV